MVSIHDEGGGASIQGGTATTSLQSTWLACDTKWNLSGVKATSRTWPWAPSEPIGVPFKRTSRPAALPTRRLAVSLPSIVLVWLGSRIPENTGVPSDETDSQVCSVAVKASSTLPEAAAGAVAT